jgi:signal transduction histidine kinase
VPIERTRLTSHEGVPLAVSLAGIVLLALVTWVAGPVLRHFQGALVPWPAHGIALAILMAARKQDRTLLAACIAVAVAAGGFANSGLLPRAIAAGTQMSAQVIVIALFHDYLSRGRHPLRGTMAYALFGVAILLGVLPITILVEGVRIVIGREFVPGFSIGVWWVASVTSMAALAPMLLAPTAPHLPAARGRRASAFEFLLLAAIYIAALLNAFLVVGQSVIALPSAVATIPFLTWAGLRFGVRGYAVFTALFVTVVVTSTILNVGPFSEFGPDPVERGRWAWIYLASLAGPAMIFPVALAERRLAEERARGAFAQLAAIIEGSGDLIAAVDRDLVIIAANPSWITEFARISGVTVHTGMRMADALAGIQHDAADSLAQWRRALAGERFTAVREIGDPDRARDEYEITYGPVRDAAGEVVGASQVVRNVTQRRKKEHEEADARRLESIGRLAGGVAHDFNNLMTAVIGYAEIVAQTLPADDPRRDDLAQIERAASRAGELTQQLLAFARRRIIEPRLVDLGELVEGFTRLLAPLLGSSVYLSVRTEPNLPPVRLDPAQFEQVLMNLAVNARDAMPGGGQLTIEIARALRGSTLGVRLVVRDTGTGMSPEVLERVWEPFFTTKPIGQGTGLGLPSVHGIVHQAGGEITVESVVGAGTAFTVFLPAADAPADPH